MKKLVKTIGRKSLVFAKGAVMPLVVPEMRNTYIVGFVSSFVKGLLVSGGVFGAMALCADAKGISLDDIETGED